MKTGVVWKLGLTVVVGAGAGACDIDPCGDAGCPGLTAGTDSGGDRGDDDDDDDAEDTGVADTGGQDGDDEGSSDSRGDDDDDDDDDVPDDGDDDDDDDDDDVPVPDDGGDDDDDDDDDSAEGGESEGGEEGGSDTGEPIDACPTVARAADVGCGRLLLWGDEHIRFDDNYPFTEALWSQAVDWLAEPGQCFTVRDTVYIGFSSPGTLEADLTAAGYTIAPVFDDNVDIAIMDANFLPSSGYTAAQIQSFVEGGGALMTTVIGFGDADECDEPNAYLEPLGIAYDCSQAPPWGDQLALTDHPVTAGLDETTLPFVNGRWVVDAGASSVPVALHGPADASCYEPPTPPQPPTAQCNTVGRTTKPGCGRVFAWGDEHVTFEDYYPGTAGFWDNSLAWLATADCGEDRTQVWVSGGLSDSVEAQIAGMGLAVSSGQPDPTTLGPGDIVIGADYTAADVAAAHAWIEDGGAMMTMIVGLGDGLPSECDDANALLTGLGMSYDCTVAAPWGPVTSFAPHPIGAGLVGADAPFVNGRWVLDEDGTSSVVAYVDPDGECTGNNEPPTPPDPQ